MDINSESTGTLGAIRLERPEHVMMLFYLDIVKMKIILNN